MLGRIGRTACVTACILALTAALCACTTSKGGNSGNNTTDPPPPPPPPPGSQPSDYETTEFFFTRGLDWIHAQYAYAEGATGAGIVVAVLDDGVDFSHPDLAAAEYPSSDPLRPPDPNADPGDPAPGEHGTPVAGIIAAAKNDLGTHGVAFESQILSLDIFAPGALSSDAIRDAVDNGADIINLSVTFGGNLTPLRDALAYAAQNGVAIFMALGNDAAGDPDASVLLAADPAIAGLMYGVGAADFGSGSAVRADFSNACGTLQYCLFAPGVLVRTTLLGGGYDFFSGTSASTPYASGAAALLLHLFPNLSADEVLQILAETADDLGVAGLDDIYGWGVINLERAVQPVGPLSVPVTQSVSVPVLGGALALGPAFGDAGTAALAGLLDQAAGLDAYRRAYRVRLSPEIGGYGVPFSIGGALAPLRALQAPVAVGKGFTAYLMARQDDTMVPRADDPYADILRREESLSLTGISVEGPLGDTGHLGFAHGQTAPDMLRTDPAFAQDRGLFFDGRTALTPALALAGDGASISVGQRLGARTWTAIGWFDGDAAYANELDRATGRHHGATLTVLQSSLIHRPFAGASLGAALTYVRERDAFLGSVATRLFGSGVAARTAFLSLSGSFDVGVGSLFASATGALTRLDAADIPGVLTWDRAIATDTYAVGMVRRGLFTSGDRIGLMVSQPLRVLSAPVTASFATSMNADGSLNWRAEQLNLIPDAREMDLELAYAAWLMQGVGLKSWAMMRLDPGHRNGAADFGLGMKLDMAF